MPSSIGGYLTIEGEDHKTGINALKGRLTLIATDAVIKEIHARANEPNVQ